MLEYECFRSQFQKLIRFSASYLNIPCPKCKKSDCFWHCYKCFERLRYQDGTIFCDCSEGILQQFEFCCINKCHGQIFYPYDNNKGLCDTSGVQKDKENLEQMLKYICSFHELHGICIMLKSGESKTTVELKYCIKQLLLHFHKTAINNFLFCFTRCHGTMAQSTPTTVNKILKEIYEDSDINLKLNSQIAYSLENDVFRYLCAKENGIMYENRYCHEEWERSRNESIRLIHHVLSNSPHLTSETIALNTMRSIIIGLNKPLAKITALIQTNKSELESQRIEIEKLTGNEKDFQSRIKISHIYIKKLTLDRWIVVCNKCAVVKRDDQQNDYKVYPKQCCEGCRAPWLYFCTEFNILGKCRKCQCQKRHHEHINYEYVENKQDVEDEEVKEKLVTVKSAIEKKHQAIEKIVEMMKELDNEQKFVNECAAKFSNYLKSNSIILNNKSHEEYLNIELENAKKIEKIAEIQNLENALEDYYNEKKNLEEQLNKSCINSFSKELTVEDVFKARNQLFELKWSGSTLRNIFDGELTNPIFHHMSSILQYTAQKQLKKDKPGYCTRAKDILAICMADFKSLNNKDHGHPYGQRIDDLGRALSKSPKKHYGLM